MTKPTLAIRNRQSGMSLIGSIFIMVVLSAIGVYMLSLNAMQHTSTSLSLQSSRALYAAESGVEWVAWYVRTSAYKDNCPASGTSFDVGNFTLNIDNCTEASITEGTNTYKIFDTQITASTTGSSFGDSDFSSRTLHSRIIGL